MQTRRCSNCRKKVPADSVFVTQLKAFCGASCLQQYIHTPKAKKERERAHRKNEREKKDKLKTRSQWMKEAQKVFNEYVRARDQHNGCISCGLHDDNNVYGGSWDCGHYRSTGSAPHLRFHLWNAHKQCVRCNRYLSGNVAQYRVSLIWKLGYEKVEALENDNAERKFDIPYLQRLIKIFRKKLKKITKKPLHSF